MDIYKKLKTDHSGILSRLDLIKKALEEKSYNDVRQFSDELYYHLETHIKAEEDTFYSDLRHFTQDEKLQEILNFFVEDHIKAHEAIKSMNELDCQSADWEKAFWKLDTCIREHIREEEDVLFPLSEEHFKKAHVSELGNIMEQRQMDVTKNISI